MRRRKIFALPVSVAALASLSFALAPGSQASVHDTAKDTVVCLFNGSTLALANITQPTDIPGNADTSSDDDANTMNGFTASGALPTEVPTDSDPTNLLDVETGDGVDADTPDGADAWPPGQPGTQDYRFDTAPSPFEPTLTANGQGDKDRFTTSCIHVDRDGATGELLTESGSNDDTSAYTANIIASGEYENLVCGTGSTNGRAVLTTVDNVATGDQTTPGGGAPIDPDTEAAALRANYWIMFTAGQGVGVAEGYADDDTDPTEPDAGARDFVGSTVVDIRPLPSGPADEGCVTTDVTDFNVTGIVAGTLDGGTASNNSAVENIPNGGGN